VKKSFTESIVEEAALSWLEELGYQIKNGPGIAPGESEAERADFSKVILEGRLHESLSRLNPKLPSEALEDAFRKLTRAEGSTLEARNRTVHKMIVEGVNVQFKRSDDTLGGAQASVVDFDNPENNDWLAVNQFSVEENKNKRRPDILPFLNGIPVVLIELKNPTDEEATTYSAFNQLQTYKAELPTLSSFNELLVASDGVEAKLGTLSAGWEWFKPWKTIEGEKIASPRISQLQVLIQGVFNRKRLLDLIRDFIVFEDSGGLLIKKMAGYHQFHAVSVAIEETLRATNAKFTKLSLKDTKRGGKPGDHRIGVIWHTQGSGKSLTMAFFAGRIIREPAMENPTLIVLTDRNDLDDQLFGTFSRCQDLLRQPPVQADSRMDLREKLQVTAGGVVFTTIQKFLFEEQENRHPLLSGRQNIVVIADEAHRSQYDFIKGFARNIRDALPHASFIGFTGTPIELTDKSTRAVFGDYISVYDIQQAVEDKATVPIYYESRLAKLQLDESEKPNIDPDFEEATEGEEVDHKERLKTKWAQLEAVVGAEKRLKLVAKDSVEHVEKRMESLEGKAMIVCMSRRICVELYGEIARLRPDWGGGDDEYGAMKVVMTGSASDPVNWQQHIRSKDRREKLANRFRDPADPFKIVLVRDMWLTGFDAPSLHTMYIDKPMRGHGLMQAIARVNRVFSNKPGGLVVDYLGLAHELKKALATYTQSGGTGKTAIDQEEAVAAMIEKYEVCCGILHGFDWSAWTKGSSTDTLTLLPSAQEHILEQENGRDRFLVAVRDLSSAFTLSVPHEKALEIRDDVSFFQHVRAVFAKRAAGDPKTAEDLDLAIRQIVSKAVASEGVVDIFAAAGLKKPDISILSEEFLAEVKDMPQRNLAVELLRKLLSGEISIRKRKNVVLAKSFAEMLGQSIRRYQNRAIEAAQVLEELIALAKEMRDADARGDALGLSDDELAFYDALEANDSAVKVLGEKTLRAIAQELVQSVRANVSIDWAVRENVRAALRVIVKRILRKHGYPPDKQEKATQTVLEQAEVLSEQWTVA
jgi:type I restriction enzyme, R subunit